MSLLQDKLIKAAQAYYTDGTSEMTDEEFDKGLEELKKEDPTNPIITQVGHGYDVNKDTTGRKVKHRYFAGSLSKCHNWQEFPKDFKQNRGEAFGLSVKLDGLSSVMYYEKGELVQALSRGDGQVGIDITEKVKKIEPDFISISDKTFTGAVRGEILMKDSRFADFKKIHPDATNSRNSATGLINGKYIEDSDLKFLNIFVYTVIGNEDPTCKWVENYKDMMRWLDHQFHGHMVRWAIRSIHEMLFEDTMRNFNDEFVYDLPCDGIVITRPIIHHEGNDVKYDAVAFKFEAQSDTTEVVDIEWSLTKTKYLVPRVKVKPVFLSGANIQYATGFNAQFIVDSGLGRGAVIQIMRSGEVIPYIKKVIKPVQAAVPARCPFCDAELVWNGVHLQCPNPDCGDAVIQDLLIWSKNIAPTMGLGDKLILDYFFDEFYEPSIESVYNHGEINNVETDSILYNKWLGMYNSLFTNKVSIEVALKAINIPRLGDINSAKLARRPDLVKMIYEHAAKGTSLAVTELIDLSSYIGTANTEAIVSNIDKFENLKFIYNNIIWEAEKPAEGEIKKVAITGKLSVKRSDFETELKAKGFIASDSITAETFALITDDPNSSSSKNAKATKLGITKITESEFREKYLG